MYTQSKREHMNNNKLLPYFVGIGTIISTAVGGVDTVIKVMASMMILDFTVGTLTAMVHGKAQSRLATKGLLKKCLSIVMVTVGVNLDRLTGQQLFRNLTIMYVICIETISLLEHMDTAEVRYPKFIRLFLNKLLGQLDEGQLSQDWKPDPNLIISPHDVKDHDK